MVSGCGRRRGRCNRGGLFRRWLVAMSVAILFGCVYGATSSKQKKKKAKAADTTKYADLCRQTVPRLVEWQQKYQSKKSGKVVSSATASRTSASGGSGDSGTKSSSSSSSSSSSKKTTQYSPLSPKDFHRHGLLQLAIDESGLTSLLLQDSAQHLATCWMLYFDSPPPRRRFRQRYAMATLFFATKGHLGHWLRSDKWLSPKHHECQWFGVEECQFSGIWGLGGDWKITSLRLSFNEVDGIFPREMALLVPHLRELDMHGNDLQGVLPPRFFTEVTRPPLQVLKLHMNMMFGHLPTHLGLMSNLRELSLYGNYFAGHIPTELAQLKKLESLDLYANQLSGTVPKKLSDLKQLRELFLNDNFLGGSMPREICDMKKNSALAVLQADCLGQVPEIRCSCCTICCQGVDKERKHAVKDPKCTDMSTGKIVSASDSMMYDLRVS